VLRSITAVIQLEPANLLQFPGSDIPFRSSFARFGELTFSSAFQPIFSLSHRRSIGYEALLRAQNPAGDEVPPLAVLGRSSARGRWNNLERGVQLLHASNFTQIANAHDRLFLNTRPDGFIVSDAYRRLVEGTLRYLQLTPARIVLEVLETPNGNLQKLVEGVASFRQLGFLIALDDFGAGQSNIDRVWQLQPDIVKLDRSVIEQATRNPRVARLLPRLVSLLHETGALVLVEGVETQHEALLAMECDADLVQGFYFARPAPDRGDEVTSRRTMDSLWQSFRERTEEKKRAEVSVLSVYTSALQTAGERFVAGIDFALTCQDFLRLEGAARCFLLDAQGEQIGGEIIAMQRRTSRSDLFRAVADAPGACWERRSYFRNALSQPGKVHVTSPYLSINGVHLCVTLSIAILVQGKMRVLCADMDWRYMLGHYDVGDTARRDWR
jgi:EAL domain-containing protein (putative c-di-GMP-specific phosphodiesterase class I)